MRERCLWAFVAALALGVGGAGALAAEAPETVGWQRIDARYCTIWLHPEVNAEDVSDRVSTWRVRPQVKAAGEAEEEKLAAKCDTLFRKAQEVLDMYPPGVHVTVRVAREREAVSQAHAARYGFGTQAVAVYVFENNTIYTSKKDVSESVLIHEMAHCIIDHYFRMRPPRKIEEMLAIYVDEQMRN